MPRAGRVSLILLLLALPVTASAADKGEASDQTAESLLAAMKAGKYATAFAMFDETMQAAVPEERLRAVWSAQVGNYGPLVSYTFVSRTQSMGLDVRVALLKFDHGELQAIVTIRPDTQEIGGFLLKPPPSAVKPAPPPPYIHPADFRSVEVTVGTAPYALGGTVTQPAGLGPFPAAVLVQGSGPQDRDETIGPNKIFKDLAEGLASRGIEVLRYDKRTFVYGAKLGDSISVDDEVVKDAIAALNLLRNRPEVDPQRVFVIGHSMGALLAPEIGVRSAPVAGVVLMAPPGRPVEDMVISQMKTVGASAKDLADLQVKAARLKAGSLGSERFLGAPQSYWKDLDARDGVAMAKKLARPMLVMRGERDYQVLAEDVETWKKGLAGMTGVELVALPGLNHLFIAGEGKPGPSEYDTPSHVDARVIEKLAAFLTPAKAK